MVLKDAVWFLPRDMTYRTALSTSVPLPHVRPPRSHSPRAGHPARAPGAALSQCMEKGGQRAAFLGANAGKSGDATRAGEAGDREQGQHTTGRARQATANKMISAFMLHSSFETLS